VVRLDPHQRPSARAATWLAAAVTVVVPVIYRPSSRRVGTSQGVERVNYIFDTLLFAECVPVGGGMASVRPTGGRRALSAPGGQTPHAGVSWRMIEEWTRAVQPRRRICSTWTGVLTNWVHSTRENIACPATRLPPRRRDRQGLRSVAHFHLFGCHKPQASWEALPPLGRCEPSVEHLTVIGASGLRSAGKTSRQPY